MPERSRRGLVITGVATALVVAVAAVGAVIAIGADGDTEPVPPLAIEEPEPPAQDPNAPDDEPQPDEATDADPIEPLGPFADQGTVTILHTRTGEVDLEAIRAMLDAFVEQYPEIEVIEQGSPDFEQLARSRVEAGNPPDILFHPQPSLLRQFWDQGFVQLLDGVVDVPALASQTIPGLADSATFDGRLAGVPLTVTPKSLVWYSPRTFDAGGYRVPETWDDLMALTRAMADDGVVTAPWCIGIESGDATGWVATDWIEDLLLRAEGVDAYDAWVAGDLAFDSPQVRGTIERYLEPIWFNDDFVLGGTSQITQVSFFDTVDGLFDGPAGCGLHRQAAFLEGFLDPGLTLGVDYDLFHLPPIDPTHGEPTMGGGDFAALYTDNAAANTFMAWLAQPEAGEAWAANGRFVSPFGSTFDATTYQRPIDRRIHDIVSRATAFRFDASDQMPAAVGTSSFWVEITRWIDGEQDLRSALSVIDRSFDEVR